MAVFHTLWLFPCIIRPLAAAIKWVLTAGKGITIGPCLLDNQSAVLCRTYYCIPATNRQHRPMIYYLGWHDRCVLSTKVMALYACQYCTPIHSVLTSLSVKVTSCTDRCPYKLGQISWTYYRTPTHSGQVFTTATWCKQKMSKYLQSSVSRKVGTDSERQSPSISSIYIFHSNCVEIPNTLQFC